MLFKEHGTMAQKEREESSEWRAKIIIRWAEDRSAAFKSVLHIRSNRSSLFMHVAVIRFRSIIQLTFQPSLCERGRGRSFYPFSCQSKNMLRDFQKHSSHTKSSLKGTTSHILLLGSDNVVGSNMVRIRFPVDSNPRQPANMWHVDFRLSP